MNPMVPNDDGSFFIPGILLMAFFGIFMYVQNRAKPPSREKPTDSAKPRNSTMTATAAKVPADQSDVLRPPEIMWAYETDGIPSSPTKFEALPGIHVLGSQQELHWYVTYNYRHRSPMKSLDGGETWIPAPEVGLRTT